MTRNLARRTALLGGAVLTGVLALVAPASAGTSAEEGNSWTLPSGPTLAAVSPTISPAAAQVRHVAGGATITCSTGNLCAAAWDLTTANWKVFDLNRCDTYYLSHWQALGPYNNAQTGGVRVTFNGLTGVVKTFTTTGPGTQNWDPVWNIRSC